MTWQEVLNSNHETVIVQSYGYMEKTLISQHFEPFKNKRDIVFHIYRAGEWSSLDNRSFMLEDSENELFFEERDGKLYLDGPDLWARP